MRIAFLGAGRVGGALADRLARAGHDVVLAARDPRSRSVRAALERNSSLRAVPVTEGVHSSEIVFLATPYEAAGDALESAGDLTDKVVVDCTNPIEPGMTLAVSGETSGGETIQRAHPEARVVKAFSIYGFENLEECTYPGELRPAMLIAGDDETATELVASLATELGWEPVVVGGIHLARCLESLALLWVHMARVQKRGPDFTWAMLRR